MPTTSFPKSSFISFDASQARKEIVLVQPRFTSEILMDLSLHVAKAVHKEWTKLAHKRLNRSLDAYLRSLQLPQVSKHAFEDFAVIELKPSKKDRWVLWIENGRDGPWDMKEALLQGEEYRRIRFGHESKTTARSGGRGQIFGHLEMSRGQGHRIGTAIARAAGQLQGAERLSVRALEQAYKGRVTVLTNSAGYRHQTSIYQNMRRTQQKSRSRRNPSGTFTSFRTVSKESDYNSWMYPAMAGEHLGKEAAKVIKDTARKYIADVVAGQIGVRRAAVSRARSLPSTRKFR